MKKLLSYVLSSVIMLLLYGNALAQLSTGDVAFTAFNADGDDDFSIVALVDIPANTTLYFTDNEPNVAGDGFDNFGEGSLQWESGATVVSAGTIVVFTDTDSGGNPSFGSSVGTLSVAAFDAGMNLSGSGDALYCVQGSPDGNNITAWLAGIQNEANNEGANFAATGLTFGTTFINFFFSSSPDGGAYQGIRSGESSFADYLPFLGDNNNWFNATSDGELILPIDTTVFTISGGVIGNPPVINCPGDVIVDAESGVCEAVVYFADASAIDVEDGPLTTDQTMGPISGSMFPVGDTTVGFSVTDLDGNISTCQFTVTVVDAEDPMVMCQDLTIGLNASGVVNITPAEIDAGSSDNCSGFTLSLDISSFDCNSVGENTVTLTITDASSNTASCTATVTVIDDIAPIVNCIGVPSGLEVFVNEIHYDNASTDVNEFVEIAGPAGTDLTGWALVAYNGNNGTSYNTTALSGTIPDEVNGFGALSFSYPTNGLQNGAPDGIALVDDTNMVLQFLSYEGSFAAVDGPANGMTSEDIGVSESSGTQIGESLQLTGTGSFYADFIWNIPLPESPGSLNVGQTINAAVVLPPYEVVLDADGTATIPVTTFVSSIDEACGHTISNGAGSTNATLASPLVGDNGNFGNMFDIVAINEVVIASFDVHGDTGLTFDVEVYAKSGTHVGSEDTPGDWTLIDTAFGVVSNGDGATTPLDLTLEYAIPAGETHAFFVSPIGGGFNYHNGTAVGNVLSSDDNIELLEGSAKADDFTGTTFAPRVFEGNIIYSVGPSDPTVFTFDCSDIGESNVEVFVTDDSGNTSSCSTAIIVSDETAPVLVCGPEPLLYDTASNAVSDSPALAIPDNTPAGVTTIIEVTDEGTVEDLNVSLDLTHTWIGDLIVSVTSPDGTTVVLHNRTGGSDDDIVVTYDDEGVAPASPLSAFDGETLLGTWTLFVSDNAGGDTGTVNTWGLIYDYEYSYPNPEADLFIELGADGTVTIEPMDILSTMEEACEIDVVLIDITEFTCDDIGTPTLVTIFANDTSGNFASCQVEVNIVDRMEPALTCPGNTVAPFDPATGLYVLPDYFDLGDAFATDNCTDASMLILTQDPAPGTAMAVTTGAPHVVTFTAEDEYGNIATCSMDLDIGVVGVEENELLANALGMYPNPATNQVTLVNSSAIALEAALIYDLNGKLVAEIDLSNMQEETTFDVSNFASGVFMVKIIGENASTVKRLIKE